MTNGQYRAFLNAVAVTDTHGLYSASGNSGDGGMGGPYGGITRLGSQDSYSYIPKDGDARWDTRPANFVSWYNALRFANWLHNGQPIGPQGPLTTEDGAYDLSLGLAVSRKPEATVVLPDCDEWYKAAYYKGGSLNNGYWDYATQNNVVPNKNAPTNDTGNSANYYSNGYTVGGPYYSTDAGSYGSSASAYGTFDQNGNIMEWSEAKSDFSAAQYYCLGGSWYREANYLPANDFRADAVPSMEVSDLGFRVALIPEPASMSLLALGGLAMLRKRNIFRTKRRGAEQ